MAKMLAEMKCKICDKVLENAEHLHLDNDGNAEYLCDDCYKIAEDFVRRGGMKNATRANSEKDK